VVLILNRRDGYFKPRDRGSVQKIKVPPLQLRNACADDGKERFESKPYNNYEINCQYSSIIEKSMKNHLKPTNDLWRILSIL